MTREMPGFQADKKTHTHRVGRPRALLFIGFATLTDGWPDAQDTHVELLGHDGSAPATSMW